MLEAGIRRDEHVVLETTVLAIRPLDPPGGVPADRDARLADELAHLPHGRWPVILRVELRRQPEVPLAPRREANLAADPRHAERADLVRSVIAPDHVPASLVRE